MEELWLEPRRILPGNDDMPSLGFTQRFAAALTYSNGAKKCICNSSYLAPPRIPEFAFSVTSSGDGNLRPQE